MKLQILLTTLLLKAIFVCAQNPGGVKQPPIWLSVENNSGFTNKPDNKFFSVSGSGIASLNFLPAIVFAGNTSLSLDLSVHDYSRSTFFTVYKRFDTANENHLWHLLSDAEISLLLTTNRATNLKDEYKNFTDVFPANPKINTYLLNKPNAPIPGTLRWIIGTKPASPVLPIESFHGLVAEVIAYNRFLKMQERLLVASYLAIKYGITLTEYNATYRNSASELLWNGVDYPAFHNNIFGIARDDSSALLQTKAVSGNNPSLLQMSTQDALANNTSLLIGDNAKPLTADDRIAGLPVLLKRKWLVVPHEKGAHFQTDLLLDTKQIDAALPLTPVYWLVIERTGSGDFSSANLEFKKMDALDAGYASFKNVVWDADSSGKDAFTMIAAQELLLYTSITNPTCSGDKGNLAIKILGGTPPYSLSITSNTGIAHSSTINDNASPVSFDAIIAGKYFITLKDAASNAYHDEFYVNNADAPKPVAVADKYYFNEGEQVTIDAAKNMPAGVLYEWTGADNYKAYTPKVTLNKPGLYTLRCSNSNGCSSFKDVQVIASPSNIFTDRIVLYPNPSTGVFNVKITLDKPADVRMDIVDEAGKVHASDVFKGFANYRSTKKLAAPGVYFLEFTSGASKLSKKLIIAR